MTRIRRLGLAAGPLLAALCYALLPATYRDAAGEAVAFSHAGRVTAAVVIWMATWWVTEAIDVAATALLPVVLLPIFGAATIRDAASPYASDLIFLFMGGFILALSMQRWGLDKRIAIITLRLVGPKPANMVGGCILATALIGGFVSNSAKAAMMLPIGLSVIVFVRERSAAHPSVDHRTNQQTQFATCIVLGIAYAASISGVSTLIGTPPNTFLAAFIRDEIDPTYQRELTFLQWLMLGVPLAAVFLPIVWLLLTRVLFRIDNKPIDGGREFIAQEHARLGPMNRAEWATFIVFTLTALAWMFRRLLVHLQFGAGADAIRPLAGLSDSGIAMLGALMLFLIPAGRRLGGGMVMDWPTAARLPWGILILFGGGLSLAAAIGAYGVAEFIGGQAQGLAGMPTLVLVIAVAAMVVIFSEVASNTATATTLIPILAALAPGLDVHPYLLIFPATMAASLAFMMPVGTPPNAMAMGTGFVTMRQMIKAGLWLNLIGIALIVAATFLLVKPMFVR